MNGAYNNAGNTPPSLNCEEKLLLGWMDSIPEAPCPATGYTLNPVSGHCGAKIPTGNPGEYYYLEYRNKTGWDRFLPEGLVIYHVDKSENIVDGKTAESRWRRLDNINGSSTHPCFDMIRASDDCVVFGEGVTEYHPAAWDGTPCPKIENISFNGSELTFDIRPAVQ